MVLILIAIRRKGGIGTPSGIHSLPDECAVASFNFFSAGHTSLDISVAKEAVHIWHMGLDGRRLQLNLGIRATNEYPQPFCCGQMR